ncbi:flagellar hook-basal body complex protein [Legionella worsleiensis]|uniref:Flagellar hook protein FlgE n=1 Tax=Legionella worsleiensis TaxID=45076 RepID=A0A0W1A602_9GAMM|nr:flagellar hook-basal body complex protein [Legionella worsleiensis]KTD76782.1 flagellar hook protein FlgE [Legionella worsleiensis]STY30606.1 flagellar hook protein FlgE [Legionella worsleiensis]
MSNTYYTSLSGMLCASYGLQNTSNNVANMQSPGFKRSDVFYSSLGNSSGEEGLGSGVRIGGQVTNFNDGKFLATNNPTDVAVNGQGFFIIKLKNGALRYTRDGEFEFNSDGILIDKHSGGQVQGYNHAGNLVPIHKKGPQTSAGKASHEIFLNGDFILVKKSEDEKNTPGALKNNYKNIKFSVATIYDNQGKAHEVELEFASTPVGQDPGDMRPDDDGTSWDLISVKFTDKTDVYVPAGQKIVFNRLNQGANSEYSSITFKINGNQEIRLEFGTLRDSADNAVQLKELQQNPLGTQIDVYQNDGYGEGKQISFAFDENGQIVYYYDNGQNIKGIFLGLARFDDLEHTLVNTQDNLFEAKNDRTTHIGRPNKNGFGSIKGNQLESSNVDSTTEFANIVILQRMFQACSQIMDIDKKLLEELESP